MPIPGVGKLLTGMEVTTFTFYVYRQNMHHLKDLKIVLQHMTSLLYLLVIKHCRLGLERKDSKNCAPSKKYIYIPLPKHYCLLTTVKQ